MFTPKVSSQEKEYKNEILLHDPWFDSEKSAQERETIRHSQVEQGHVWISVDPAETSVGFRMERRYPDRIEGIYTLRFSIYTNVYEFTPTLPHYGILDEAVCSSCGKTARWKYQDQLYCGTHSSEKKNPGRTEILRGRKKSKSEEEQGKYKWMSEYHNILRFLKGLDVSKVRYAVVEHQMAIAYRSTRMAQHLISILMMLLRSSSYYPLILEIDPKIKSRVYGVSLKRIPLKQWTMRKAIWNASHRGERSFLELFVLEPWPQKLIERVQNGMTMEELWILVEPERNAVTKREREHLKRKSILRRTPHQLFDMADATEQIESIIIEMGLDLYHIQPVTENFAPNQDFPRIE